MKRILVVDDQAQIRMIYGSLLTAEGFEVLGVSSAEDANETLKHECIDLVLLDLRMPETDGLVLYDLIRLFHKDVKVIISSVYSVDKQKKMVTDAADYYDKSQSVEVLLAKIRNILSQSEPDVRMCWDCFCEGSQNH